MATLNTRNNMRNTPLNRGIVDNIRKVKTATGEFRAIRARIEDKASPTLMEKSKKALAALESALPPRSMLYKMDHGMEGMVDDSPSIGVSREAHLVRRMGGADEISRNAHNAKEAVSDFQRTLAEETSVATVIRSKMQNKEASRWARMLSAGRKVASAIAVTATGIASYLSVSYGMGQAVDSVAVAGAALVSATVFTVAVRLSDVPKAKAIIPEARELQRDVLPRLQKALNSL
jgi:hypothetical protein